MILGALLDVGLALDDLRGALGSLAIDPGAVWTERVMRAGVSATKFHVRDDQGVIDHAHDHEHGHDHRHDQSHDHGHDVREGHEEHGVRHRHSHRSLKEIDALIDGSALSRAGRHRAKELFAKLGEVEAGIHGTSMDEVHLHEVGSLDSIIDIVGTVYALETLRPDRIVVSPLNVGSGSVRAAHGLYPVPAPATMKLLEGVPIYAGSQTSELVTPTGALLLTAYADHFDVIPPMRLQRIGYGAGSKDFRDTPNVLRVLVGEGDGIAASHRVVVIEAEIDDMNPQIFGILIDRLLAKGALDVFYTAIQMKKNRPGTLVSIVAPPEARERLTAVVFGETTTIGVRYREMDRECLDRETIAVDTPFGRVGIKVARRHGALMNASPEFDDCIRLAAETGKPVKDIQAAAVKAFLDRRE